MYLSSVVLSEYYLFELPPLNELKVAVHSFKGMAQHFKYQGCRAVCQSVKYFFLNIMEKCGSLFSNEKYAFCQCHMTLLYLFEEKYETVEFWLLLCFPLVDVGLFILILYALVNNFSVMSGRVLQGWTSTKQRIKWLAQGHKAVPLVSLDIAILQSITCIIVTR